MQLIELQRYLDTLLNVTAMKDYCPNGLQVEGRPEVARVVCGVTASQALLDAAVERQADAVLVHHGYFWRGEDARVVGLRKRRLSTLLRHDISLLAYHLPLDVHPELGNNAQLARLMGWTATASFGEQSLGLIGDVPQALPARALAQQLGATLGREAQLVGDGDRVVRRVAWCTGAAQSFLESAVAAGCDVFVSGEISEPTVHLARESGVPYIAAGHHATERYGIQALGEHLAEQFGLACQFVDIDNPV
ncbi:MAG TPA: Nif3-like dinuclear metal center hexameric protein [Denitromonas sp.]|uniref:Nif3-like dinuclear metal center hexameric protein n=1 Tax=Denitromonas sp. TaxID=2734609 RepID=UPI001D633D4E|nr:Nif3-like dinuclear metal center hexameric protein [Rhodocyclaceae bacterium]HQV13978.1 Nif3-like dinuclear metal center hexameric protein [Denitromonas sp.]